MPIDRAVPGTESTHQTRRFDLPVTAGWNRFVEDFESAVPAAEPTPLGGLSTDPTGSDGMAGGDAGAAPHGFLVLWKDANVLLRLFPHGRRCVTYTVGNLAMAESMYLIDPTVMLYVPFRLALHESADGVVVLSFDQPSSALASLGSPAITAVGHALDDELADLLESLEITAPDALRTPPP
jgi:hypothetical protein